jgi:hypothetical protein
MTTRTFKQLGQGYGSVPTSIVVTLDGTEIFSGPISTLDQPLPTFPDSGNSYGIEIFSWTDEVTFAGSKSLSISVSGSPLLLTDTQANYILIPNPDYSPPDPKNPTTEPVVPEFISGGANVYGTFYFETIDTVTYSDPFTDEAIDGTAQSGPPDPSLPGQWYWKIPAGSTFTATVNIQPGVE